MRKVYLGFAVVLCLLLLAVVVNRRPGLEAERKQEQLEELWAFCSSLKPLDDGDCSHLYYSSLSAVRDGLLWD